MEDIESHLRFWLDMSTAIVMHEQIQSRIQKYHIRLRSFCLKSELRTFSGIEKLRGDSELLDLSKKDHLALLEQLCDESAFRSIMEKIDARNHATLDAISILIQQRMSKFDSEDRRQRGLQRHERGPMPGPRSTADRRCNSVGWIILLLYAVYLILVLLALRYTSLHEWDGKTRKQDVIVVGI
ncbi:hypothetical protein NEOLEDRAFT_635679 [Neolentinus lepideus HHB14362 ss-1]|uniref:Uncharacterized protein n=1 Tax=Neolentinus lepideus HHB14362 ss-1 TaxID=1314782 RepID=A0A165QN62_9AGAM|nr:hypothetical protein NEOLEDRAFT_635679 [Neolentinus lepideus HHB14362 ss-1]